MRLMRILLGSMLLLLWSCGGEEPVEDPGATETNVVPAPCATDEDCPEGIACVYFDPDDENGHCDAEELSD